jgi:hypothetical protein
MVFTKLTRAPIAGLVISTVHRASRGASGFELSVATIGSGLIAIETAAFVGVATGGVGLVTLPPRQPTATSIKKGQNLKGGSTR